MLVLKVQIIQRLVRAAGLESQRSSGVGPALPGRKDLAGLQNACRIRKGIEVSKCIGSDVEVEAIVADPKTAEDDGAGEDVEPAHKRG